MTFNIELFRRSVDANGATEISENEFFGDLTMDPTSPRYAVTLLTDDSGLVDATLPGGALASTNAGFSQSALLLPMDDPGTIAVLDPLLAEGNRIVIAVDGGAAVNVTLCKWIRKSKACWIVSWKLKTRASLQHTKNACQNWRLISWF